MIRIRFHGRGGHGVKTASRILGTAAFLSGYQSQDSPIYGAERRGAAVTSSTRIDRETVLERGVIAQPDLIVVGDETLLADPAVGVLAGQQFASAVLVNAASVDGLADRYHITPGLIALDITEKTLAVLGRASALSAALGAAAARLVGCIEPRQLETAVRQELQYLELPDELIEKNVRLADEVFSALPVVEFQRQQAAATPDAMHTVGYELPTRSAPSILDTGNAAMRQTGGWRLERPIVDRDACTRCGLCFVACPDGAIALDRDGYPVVDYDHCKGCMICREVCPLEAIRREKEVRAW